MGTVEDHLRQARAAEEAEAAKTPAQRKAEAAAKEAAEKKTAEDKAEKAAPQKKK